jgi:hypothetical protein
MDQSNAAAHTQEALVQWNIAIYAISGSVKCRSSSKCISKATSQSSSLLTKSFILGSTSRHRRAADLDRRRDASGEEHALRSEGTDLNTLGASHRSAFHTCPVPLLI